MFKRQVLALTTGMLISSAALAQSQQPQLNIGPPVAQPGWRFGAQFGPSIPTSDLGDAVGTGISLRLRVGPEYMFGRFGVSPGGSFQFARWGGKEEIVGDSAVIYLGFLPGVQAAAHLGMFAPYLGMGMGFDHFNPTGDYGSADSANGFGFEINFGCDAYFTSQWAAGMMFQIHPGFASANNLDTGFFNIMFGGTYAF